MFALIDCNNFYASCERVFNPNLQNKPVAILSNNDGCVISMSDETKKLQLPFGAPIFKWEQFCKEKNITVLSSNYPLYGDMSTRVMNILADFSPDVEVYSIDESFLELKGFENYNLEAYATKIRSRVLKWTGIPTCVGVAPTKALTKVANKIARSNLKLRIKVTLIFQQTNQKYQAELGIGVSTILKQIVIILIFIFISERMFTQTAGLNYQAYISNSEEIQIPGANIKQNQVPLSLEDVSFRFSITRETFEDIYTDDLPNFKKLLGT